MPKVREAERWGKSRSTERPSQPNARGRKEEGLNDEAVVAICISSHGFRHAVTQIIVNWKPCYSVLEFTESVGIAED